MDSPNVVTYDNQNQMMTQKEKVINLYVLKNTYKSINGAYLINDAHNFGTLYTICLVVG